MWTRISLKNRIFIHLVAIFLVTLSGAAIMVWYSYSIEGVLTAITDENLVAFQSAESLEITLVNQKGFVSYYFLDGNPDWLIQLEKYRRLFSEQLGQARVLAQSPMQKQAIDHIADEYAHYIREKDQVISYYKAGEVKFGSKLHQEVRSRFFDILQMCEEYKREHTQSIMAAKEEALIEAARLRDTAMAVIVTHILLVMLLAYLLVYQILNPLRALIRETSRNENIEKSGNDVKTLSQSVRGLIEDVGQTQVELEKSRETLLQADKMAMVGKLAAGMAHSVRNPFTSVKMRLFSLNRSLKLSGTQKEDFDVISEEIDHIDTIVQNFLEYSRPPKLKMQPVSPSTVVDTAIQLLRYRLESYNVQATIHRNEMLPAIDADPDQLKEVLVNLIVNACEAMTGGGTIDIHERVIDSPPNRRQAEICISDNGPGIASSEVKKVFDPFYTTKEDGTGLGLSIVSRIIKEHGGSVDLTSEEDRGTTFCIVFPTIGGNL
ncbi:ATP-binding protein [uncultured Desulfosarcina sp.]|uniref:ATP-binding protein n=1 Tax=uncultured Desulfosarcina sp. TaxID=218289 RepID=UPI0029C85353|nr:ATP-binding protein [uncultured Desulfosarcina sp.]